MFCRVLRLILLSVVLSLIIFPSQVLALGLGVTPGKLDFTTFRVYIEGEYQEWFLITPGEFILPPQQSKGVEIMVTPPLTALGEHEFSVCVVSLPPGSDLRIGAGIKVSAHVQILEFPIVLILGGGATALALLAGILIWRRRKASND